MNNLSITMNGKTYELSTKLRVAYKIQGQHGHKPYAEVFQGIDKMTLEQQINMLYAAFEVANPEDAKTISQIEFLNYYLDNMDLSTMMDHLKAVIEGILGKIDKKPEDAESESKGN